MNLKKLLVQSLLWRSFYFASVLLVNIFLSRFLRASATGNLYYLTSIFSLIQLVAGISLESGITYFASGKIIAFNKLLWLSVAWSFIIGLVVLSGCFVYLQYFKHSEPYEIIQYSFFIVCYITGILLTNYSCVLFYAQGNYVMPNIVLSLLNIAFIITIPFNTGNATAAQVNSVTYRYFLVFFIQGVALVLVFMAKNKSWQQFTLPGMRELLLIGKYSLVALAANVIFFLVYRIDYWFVHINSDVCTPADLGNYIKVSKLGQLMLIVPQIIASVIFPRSASGADRAELNTSLMIIARLLSQLYLVIIACAALFGRWLFVLVFGYTFNRMQAPFLIIMPGIFCLSVLALLSAYFSGKGNLRVNVAGAAIALVVVIAGDYFLVPLMGIIGAAIVSTIGYFVNLLYSLLQFYKDYSISWSSFFKWQRSDYRWLKSLL
ncbi:MAG TPA: polysaccharide biosynthesis C-terminal domain-containing protein, partial [Chitinophagaceae bacterium]|nr:polysaccharide biosynthesis C-terminal domain-containing protein [Chitinophagaceae bacterium]